MKKYIPKKITGTEIQEIRDSVERAHMRVRANSPGIKPFFKRIFGLFKDGDEDSFPAEQIADEMYLVLARVSHSEAAKCFGEDVNLAKANVLKRADARSDHDFFGRLSNAMKSPAEIQPTLTENFLLFFWARGSFAFTAKDNFPPLALFTVKDLSRLVQVVFETSGTTESSLEAIIGRKLKLKTIKHSKVTSAQAGWWIDRFKEYKANHSVQIKDKLDVWGSFLREQEFVNFVCKETGKSPAEAKDMFDFFTKNREAIRRSLRGKHSDKARK